jgi:hypothetical protein
MTTNQTAIQVDFKKALPLKLKSLGAGLYVDGKGGFWERPWIDRRRTRRKLNATTQTAARKEIAAKRADQARAQLGLARDPYKVTDALPLSELCDFYTKSGCPKRKSGKRTTQTLREEITRVDTLKQFWGKRTVDTISPETFRQYHAWRIQRIKHGRGGDRQVDKELVTLSNVIHWALQNPNRTGVKTNPCSDRPTFRIDAEIKHCRDHQPANAEELHALARYLFTSQRSEVLGWLALFQAMIGQRVSELVRLRLDAREENEPGRIHRNCLFLFRSSSSKGTYPYAKIGHELQECLRVFQIWHAQRYPGSPWYFPSPEDPRHHVTPEALTHALRRISAAMGIGHKTSHGLRSYFVNVLRSKGIPDGEIALRIGQRTGGRLIVDVYGEILPYKITWLPDEDTPAWSQFLPNKPAEQLTLKL